MTTKIQKILAENLKMLRIEAGFKTRASFSKATGLDYQIIVATERCRSFPRPKALEQMAKACKVEVFELFMPTSQRESFLAIRKLAKELGSNSKKPK
jgi:transcriptional regulator with XRE-family HTH domain